MSATNGLDSLPEMRSQSEEELDWHALRIWSAQRKISHIGCGKQHCKCTLLYMECLSKLKLQSWVCLHSLEKISELNSIISFRSGRSDTATWQIALPMKMQSRWKNRWQDDWGWFQAALQWDHMVVYDNNVTSEFLGLVAHHDLTLATFHACWSS